MRFISGRPFFADITVRLRTSNNIDLQTNCFLWDTVASFYVSVIVLGTVIFLFVHQNTGMIWACFPREAKQSSYANMRDIDTESLTGESKTKETFRKIPREKPDYSYYIRKWNVMVSIIEDLIIFNNQCKVMYFNTFTYEIQLTIIFHVFFSSHFLETFSNIRYIIHQFPVICSRQNKITLLTYNRSKSFYKSQRTLF